MSFGFYRNRHALKIGLFSVIVLFSMKAATSAPLFLVEKVIDQQRLTVTITSSQLPEIKNIVLTCSYAIPKVSLMESIVSSPLPGTALSVLVDSATSTLAVTINAATTVAPKDNAKIVLLKIPAGTTVKAADFAVIKAVIFDNKGASTEVTVTNKLTGIEPRISGAAIAWQHAAGSRAVYRLDGRKMPYTLQQRACGLSIERQNGVCIASIVSVK